MNTQKIFERPTLLKAAKISFWITLVMKVLGVLFSLSLLFAVGFLSTIKIVCYKILAFPFNWAMMFVMVMVVIWAYRTFVESEKGGANG